MIRKWRYYLQLATFPALLVVVPGSLVVTCGQRHHRIPESQRHLHLVCWLALRCRSMIQVGHSHSIMFARLSDAHLLLLPPAATAARVTAVTVKSPAVLTTLQKKKCIFKTQAKLACSQLFLLFFLSFPCSSTAFFFLSVKLSRTLMSSK